MFWSILHTIFSLGMFAGAVFILSNWRERYIAVERFGIGLTGGAGLLRIDVIWSSTSSPFYEWAPTLMTAGFMLFLFGRGWRDWRHTHNNRRQVEIAEAYFRAKGGV